MDKKQLVGPLQQVKWRAEDILTNIDRFQSTQNESEKEILLGSLKHNVVGLMEVWESFELSLGTGPDDPPE